MFRGLSVRSTYPAPMQIHGHVHLDNVDSPQAKLVLLYLHHNGPARCASSPTNSI